MRLYSLSDEEALSPTDTAAAMHSPLGMCAPRPYEEHNSMTMPLRPQDRAALLLLLALAAMASRARATQTPSGIASLWASLPGDHHDITIRRGRRLGMVPFQMLTRTQ